LFGVTAIGSEATGPFALTAERISGRHYIFDELMADIASTLYYFARLTMTLRHFDADIMRPLRRLISDASRMGHFIISSMQAGK
jgi:hypothetical protein